MINPTSRDTQIYFTRLIVNLYEWISKMPSFGVQVSSHIRQIFSLTVALVYRSLVLLEDHSFFYRSKKTVKSKQTCTT